MSGGDRGLWLAVCLLVSLIVGGVAGVLSRANGAKTPGAVLAGGAAFGGALVVSLGVLAFMTAAG